MPGKQTKQIESKEYSILITRSEERKYCLGTVLLK